MSGVYNFRVDGHGIVEISGTADPNILLEKLGRTGRKAELQWLQFGECSNNLFITQNQSGYGGINYNQDGRYLHADNIIRPKLPSHENIIRPSLHHIHDYNHHYHQSYDHNYGYSHYYDNSGYRRDEGQIHYRPARGDDDHDMACCIVM